MQVKEIGYLIKPKQLKHTNTFVFEIPPTYCEFLNIKSGEKMYMLARQNGKQLTLFLNKEKDSVIKNLPIVISNAFSFRHNNVYGFYSENTFFSVKLVIYNETSASIKYEQLERLPRYND